MRTFQTDTKLMFQDAQRVVSNIDVKKKQHLNIIICIQIKENKRENLKRSQDKWETACLERNKEKIAMNFSLTMKRNELKSQKKHKRMEMHITKGRLRQMVMDREVWHAAGRKELDTTE